MSLETETLFPQEDQNRKQQQQQEWIGTILLILSTLMFSSNTFLVKVSTATFHPLQLVFARGFAQTFFGLIGCWVLGENPFGDKSIRKWLVARGICGAISLALFFIGLSYLPLSDATVLFFTNPIFAAIFARFMLQEHFGPFQLFVCTLCVVGVTLVSQPSFLFASKSETSLFGTMICLAASLISAFVFIFIRKIGRQAHYLSLVISFGIFSVLLSMIAVFEFRWPTNSMEWMCISGIMICSFLGQCLMNSGVQRVKAGKSALIRSLDVVFAFLLGIFALNESTDILKIIGAFIVLCCIALIATIK